MSPVVLCSNCSAVSCAEMLTTYSVIMPFRDSAGGGFQVMCRDLASTADSAILTGAAEGTRNGIVVMAKGVAVY